MEPPGLVQLEKEIAEEEQRAGRLNETGPALLSWQFRPSPHSALHSRSVYLLSLTPNKIIKKNLQKILKITKRANYLYNITV